MDITSKSLNIILTHNISRVSSAAGHQIFLQVSYSLPIKSPQNTSILWHVFQEHGTRGAYAPYSTIKACIVPDSRGNVDK